MNIDTKTVYDIVNNLAQLNAKVDILWKLNIGICLIFATNIVTKIVQLIQKKAPKC
jgi:hypothetical protein